MIQRWSALPRTPSTTAVSRTPPSLACLVVVLATGCGDDALAPVVHDDGDAWTLAVLPDTQYYASNYPEIFDLQTRWLVEHETELNIRYAVHEGDIVDVDNATQWQNASRSMRLLDGRLPYSVLPGNHDYPGAGGISSRDGLMNQYFPIAAMRAWNLGLVEAYEQDRIENTAHHFNAGGREYIIISLEFGPRDRVVTWAKDVLTRHASCIGIVVTHAYLYGDGTRYDWAAKGSAQDWNPHSYLDRLGEHVNDGQELWDRLVAPSANVRMVLSGHAIGVSRRTGIRDGAPPVYELMADFQGYANGGDGWLRLMEFRPDATVVVRTYSPYRNEYMTDPNNLFTFQL